MDLLNRKQVKYAFSAIGLGALLFGLYKAFRFFTRTPIPLEQSNQDNPSEKSTKTEIDDNEHIPYQQLIEDIHKQKLGGGSIKKIDHLRQLNYRIILMLMKGNSYQGIVNLSFILDQSLQQDFKLNFNGTGVKFLLVNGVTLDSRDVKYIDHQIIIPKQLLKDFSKNNIQIIFQNHYSFLNHGMSAYFTIDQNHKYSLRQQVIYSINGYLQIERMIPCVNCLNQCKVQVQVIHPDTFEVFSNTSKSLERFCSITQYQKYPFLFDLSSNSLNKSFKLNASTISNVSNGSGVGSGMGDSSSQYSTSNYYNRKKANTIFYPQKLSSIHHLFVFSSVMVQLQPSTIGNALQEQVLLRYFCKHTESHKFVKNVNKVHNYILDVFRRLNNQKIREYVHKIDVLIIGDKQIEGYFAPGVIILSEDSIGDGNVQIRCLYLIARAIYAVLKLKKGQNILGLNQILELNQTIFNKFEQFRNFLYIKNQKYQRIRSVINNGDLGEYLTQNEGHFIKYYSKQLKFVIRESVSHKISFQLNNLMLSFNPGSQQEFWENFLSSYNFLSPLITQPLIKLGIKKLKVPTKQKLLDQLKLCFNSSKYIIHFYTNQEISENLPKFIECESYGLQARLTQLKVKQKFKDYITQKYQKYLPIKSNFAQAEAIYNQFKKFNQSRNFHHISLLKSEIKRVGYFGKNFVHPERVHIDCSITGWKLLGRMKIYPLDEDYYRLIKNIDQVEE